MTADPKPPTADQPPADQPIIDTRPVDPVTGKPQAPAKPAVRLTQAPGEEDGPKGPEPTRYGDWERKGIVSDF